jgi:hypothetical protein
MLNLFQHLINSTGYETLKLVQGDKKILFTSSSIINACVINDLFPVTPACRGSFPQKDSGQAGMTTNSYPC